MSLLNLCWHLISRKAVNFVYCLLDIYFLLKVSMIFSCLWYKLSFTSRLFLINFFMKIFSKLCFKFLWNWSWCNMFMLLNSVCTLNHVVSIRISVNPKLLGVPFGSLANANRCRRKSSYKRSHFGAGNESFFHARASAAFLTFYLNVKSTWSHCCHNSRPLRYFNHSTFFRCAYVINFCMTIFYIQFQFPFRIGMFDVMT